MRSLLGRPLFVAALALGTAGPGSVQASLINFTFTSTTNNTYNDKAYLQNTGVHVTLGDILVLQGNGAINVGGGFTVKSNFDMGLISPTNSPTLVRDYHGVGNNYTCAPIPVSGEAVFFTQQRTSLSDQHDMNLTVTAPITGYFYLGMYDSYFADNTGSHNFTIQVTPEPASLPILGLLLVPFCCHRRRTNSLVRGV